MEIFLISIVLVWLIFATLSDIKTKEIPNWLNFSLIIFSILVYSLISLKSKSVFPLLYSVITFITFFIIGSIMYYSKQWGGGDAKLLAALGAALPVYPEILKRYFTPKFETAFFPTTIILNIIITGAIYGIIILLIKIIQNRKVFLQELKSITKRYRKLGTLLLIISIFVLIISYFTINNYQIKILGISLGILIIFLFFLMIIIKAAEASSMYKVIPVSKLREGDWVSKKITINSHVIYEPRAAGISKEQIEEIKKHFKEIEIKEGIVFMPTFLIAVIISLTIGNPILWLF